MLQKEVWNGVAHLRTTWDGLVLPAIEAWTANHFYAVEYFETIRVTPDHLAVTVDYHV
jgi:hypothetical protein